MEILTEEQKSSNKTEAIEIIKKNNKVECY